MVDDSKNSRKMSMGNRFCQSTTGIKFVRDLNIFRSKTLFIDQLDLINFNTEEERLKTEQQLALCRPHAWPYRQPWIPHNSSLGSN